MPTNISELQYRIKRHFRFSSKEVRDLTLTMIVLAFIFGYNDRAETFNAVHWGLNYLKMFLIVFLTVIVHEIGHKIAALQMGLKAEYKAWPTGLLIGLMFTFLSKGKWYVVLPGGMILSHMAILRIGHFRYGLNYITQGMLATAGPIANLIFATFWKTLALFNVFPEFFNILTFINLYYAVWTFLPLPNLDGIHMFYGSRLWYVFAFGTLLSYILLYVVGFYSLIFALLGGGVIWLVYYAPFEREAWG